MAYHSHWLTHSLLLTVPQQALGVDDPRILPIIASIGAAFAFLFSSWSNKQDNDEFFEGYQKTERKVSFNV